MTAALVIVAVGMVLAAFGVSLSAANRRAQDRHEELMRAVAGLDVAIAHHRNTTFGGWRG